MRDKMNDLIFNYGWASGVVLISLLRPEAAWSIFWALVTAFTIALIVRIGYAVYDAGRRSADKED